MPTFTNLSDLFKYIEKEIPINLEKIGEEVKSVLRNNVRLLWYGRSFTPTHYTRTMEYIDSISLKKAKKVGDSWQVEIYFDTDKINPYPAENGEWSKHESITNGEDMSAAIPYFIEFGNNPNGKNPIYEYEGVRPVGETIDWIKEDNYLRNRMIELLEMKGYKVS